MKRILALILSTLLLTGCGAENQQLDRMMAFRASLLSSSGCRFDAVVTADYQTELYQFTMDCRCDELGNVYFTVIEPQSINGISGDISNQGGKLTFNNDQGLAFELMADGEITPVSAPWLLTKTLRGGNVTSCADEGDLMRVSIDDTYEEDSLKIDIWFSDDDRPINADILWSNRRILSLEVRNFEIL